MCNTRKGAQMSDETKSREKGAAVATGAGAVAGATAGVCGVVGGAASGTAGAAALTSGLAAVGSVVGGGMLAGIITIAAENGMLHIQPA